MTASRGSGRKLQFVQWFVHLLVIFVCFGKAVPDVNESHYLTKSKHAWDSSFAPGDLFLESHDSHFLAAGLAGILAWIAPLSAVAWIGRLISWSLVAWAWIGFCRALGVAAFLSPLALASWYFAMHYGHWAGEWAIGGFEAKSIAYPLVLKGVADCIEGRWKFVWLWMGLAVAWHPVVGGWAGLSVGLIWLTRCLRNDLKTAQQQVMSQLPWLALGGLIGMIGALPALAGLGGPDRIGNVVASQVQVYYRLAHHMCPRTFAPERHAAALLSLLALLVVTSAWFGFRRLSRKSDAQPGPAERLCRLLQIAWIAVSFALVGLLLDTPLATYQPILASKFLRFYWFRWADVAVPLAWTVGCWQFASLTVVAAPEQRLSGRYTQLFGRLVLTLGTLVVVACMVLTVTANWQRHVPPADELVVESRGPIPSETDRYLDWLAVCAWIRENTPEDSLWLTPKYQQTFKWHTERAEVVCWKDAPQDSAALIEWYDRIQNCEPPRTAAGKLAEWTTDDLIRLHREYGFTWILLDRTVQRSPPMLEHAYPINIDNPSFAVFRIDQQQHGP
jgi:hypothetical protein